MGAFISICFQREQTFCQTKCQFKINHGIAGGRQCIQKVLISDLEAKGTMWRTVVVLVVSTYLSSTWPAMATGSPITPTESTNQQTTHHDMQHEHHGGLHRNDVLPMSRGLAFQTLKQCAGSIPSGWIKADDAWNPTLCGSPDIKTFNEWTLVRLDTRLIGEMIEACTTEIPSGWRVLEYHWDPSKCGRPGSALNNVMTIQRSY